MTHFSAELKVGHHNGYLGAGDDDNDEENEEESKDVVELILPDCLHSTQAIFNRANLWMDNIEKDLKRAGLSLYGITTGRNRVKL